jgi:hypothetical protein
MTRGLSAFFLLMYLLCVHFPSHLNGQDLVSEYTYLDLNERLENAHEYIAENAPLSEDDRQFITELVDPVLETPYLDLLSKARIILFLMEENSEGRERRKKEASSEFQLDGEGLPPLVAEVESIPSLKELRRAQAGFTRGLISFGLMGVSFAASSLMDSLLSPGNVGSTIFNTWGLTFAGTGLLSLTFSLPVIARHALAEEQVGILTDPEDEQLRTEALFRQYAGKLEEYRYALDGRDRYYRDLKMTAFLGLTSLIGSGFAMYNADTAFQRYKRANYTEDAVKNRTETQLFTFLTYGGLGSSAMWLGTTLALGLLHSDAGEIHRNLAVMESNLLLGEELQRDEVLSRQIARLEERRQILLDTLVEGVRVKKNRGNTALLMFGSGAAGALGMVVSKVLGETVFDYYNTSMLEAEAEGHRINLAIWDALRFTAGLGSWGLLSTGVYMLLDNPDLAGLKREIRSIDRELTYLKARQVE